MKALGRVNFSITFSSGRMENSGNYGCIVLICFRDAKSGLLMSVNDSKTVI